MYEIGKSDLSGKNVFGILDSVVAMVFLPRTGRAYSACVTKSFHLIRHVLCLIPSVVTLGVSASIEHKFDNLLTVYGAGKIGVAFTNIDVEASTRYGSAEVSDSGSAFAAIIEVGARYPIYKKLDIGLAAKYSYINQQTNDGDDRSNLGGLALVGQVGFNF